MKHSSWLSTVITLISTVALPASAAAAVLKVPAQHATIQEAVSAASPGDFISVSAGEHCGATIDKPVTLLGHGRATIMGCEDGPALPNGARIGFFLPGQDGASPASGTSILGFSFDGEGISNENLTPLAFGVFGRFASDVRVGFNRFHGTVQAITNTAGDRWTIVKNSIHGLTLFDCTTLCTGGDGIVVQPARGGLAVPGGVEEPLNRPESNLIAHNLISGSVPDGFDVFSMAGILLFAADGTQVRHNVVRLPDNPDADAEGQGIVVTNTCCGETTPLTPGSRDNVLAFNDLKRTEIGIRIEGTGGANTDGLKLIRNIGSVEIEGVVQPRPPRPHHPRRWAWKGRFF